MSGTDRMPPDDFDPIIRAALDRVIVPPLSADFADRVMSALDSTPAAAPILPKPRPARDRRSSWVRRHITIIGASLVLGAATMSAAATGVLSDFGIKIPVVTDYVTHHLGIKSVHFWHHRAVTPVLKTSHRPRGSDTMSLATPAEPPLTSAVPNSMSAPSQVKSSPIQTTPPQVRYEPGSQNLAARPHVRGPGGGAPAGATEVSARNLYTHIVHHPQISVHRLKLLPAIFGRSSFAGLANRPEMASTPLQERSRAPYSPLNATRKGSDVRPLAPAARNGPAPIPDEFTHLQTPEERAARRAEQQNLRAEHIANGGHQEEERRANRNDIASPAERVLSPRATNQMDRTPESQLGEARPEPRLVNSEAIKPKRRDPMLRSPAPHPPRGQHPRRIPQMRGSRR